MYLQATGRSTSATFGLLFIVFLSLTPCLISTFLTVGRTWWALSRDNATPFASFFSRVNERLSCPIPATLLTGLLTTAFGAITIGSKTAFSDLAGSFVILSTTSYALAIGGNLFTGRRNVPRGWFWMGNLGFLVNGVAVVTIILFNIMFCFPYGLPVTVETMNYNSVILAGVVALTAFWWVVHGQRKFPGPKLFNFSSASELRGQDSDLGSEELPNKGDGGQGLAAKVNWSGKEEMETKEFPRREVPV